MPTPVSSKGCMWAWLQLVRPPNLPTVPGDPIAGFLLASLALAPVRLTTALLPALSATLLYTAGLILNDVADLHEDLTDRPQRPLPSGQVSRQAATMAALGLTVVALGLAACCSATTLTVSVLLCLLIAAYNFFTRRSLIFGCINMGLCRATSLLLGASVLGPASLRSAPVGLGAACLMLYISSVTFLAARETERITFGSLRWLPLSALLPLALLFVQLETVRPAAILLAAGSLIWAGWHCHTLSGTPTPQMLQRTIGGLIRGLLWLQATLCAVVSGVGTAAACVLLVLIPVSAWLAKRFYAT